MTDTVFAMPADKAELMPTLRLTPTPETHRRAPPT